MTLPANATRLPHTVSTSLSIRMRSIAIRMPRGRRSVATGAHVVEVPPPQTGAHLRDLPRAFYFSILISEFLAPHNFETRNARFIFAPPQAIHPFHNGQFIGPFVYGFDYKRTWRT